jgi:signal transduction histidine kinase
MVIGFVAAGIAVEAIVSTSINIFNAFSGARIWLDNGRTGAVRALEDRSFSLLEAEAEDVAGDPAVAAAFAAADPTRFEGELTRRLMPRLTARWLIIDPGAPAPVRSGMPACDDARPLLAALANPRDRAIVWCGEVPVLLARMKLESTRGATAYLGEPLGRSWIQDVKRGSLNEVELWGPHGTVASTIDTQSGAVAHQTFQPADVALLSQPANPGFGRFELALDGPYLGYFPNAGTGAYSARLASTGAQRFDVFALSSVFDPDLGPADLRVVLAVPADLMLLGPVLSGIAMVLVGLIMLAGLGFLARRLVSAFSTPLTELEQAARRSAEDGSELVLSEQGGTFELSSLRASFAAMTRRMQLTENRAAQSEKMAALGTLAGGVAHEINNPLGVILGFAQGLDRRVPPGDPLRLPVTSIVREALRCKALVQELLTDKRTEEAVDFAAAVESSLILLGARARTQGVEIVPQIAPQLPRVRGNSTQLTQVLVNLGTNALDAMKGGGTLTIRASVTQGEIVLEVADTGHGIPPEIRPRIFEPFFTTKGVGEGTGLGLSLVYKIVEQHRGHIGVVSSNPHGTVMRVALPAQGPQVRA